MDEFTQILGGILSPDNAARSQAEAAYQSLLSAQPLVCCSNLVNTVAASSVPLPVRVLACVLLRQVVKSSWSAFDNNTKNNLHQTLLKTLESEDDPILCRRLCFVIIAEPAESLSQRRDLVPLVLKMIDSGRKEVVYLNLLDMLSEFAMDSVLAAGYENSVRVLQKCLNVNDPAKLAAQLAAVATLCSFALSMKDPRPKLETFMKAAVPIMMNAVANGLTSKVAGERQAALKALEVMCAVSNKCMWAFDPSLQQVCSQLVDTAASDSIEDGGREMSLEFLSEILRKRGKTITADAAFVKKCLTMLLKLQCTDEEWAADWEDDQQPTAQDMLQMTEPGLRGSALTALLCMSQVLGDVDAFLNTLFEMVAVLLRSDNWLEKSAGLASIGIMTQSQGEKISSVLQQVMQLVVPVLRDSNPRLQYAACTCLFQVFASEGVAGAAQDQFFSTTLPGLTALIGGNTVPAVKCCACQCLAAFNENIQESSENKDAIIIQHVEAVMKALVHCLQTGSLKLQEDAMIALSSVANLSGEKFGAFYNDLLPGIKGVLSQSGESAASELKVASMCCLASIAEAVGRERFSSDAMDIMRILLSDGAASNLIELDGVFEFSKRVCAVMKEDFLPFVPHVLTPMLQAVNVDVNVRLEDVAGQDCDKTAVAGANGEYTTVQNIRGQGTYRVSANIFAYQARINALDAIDGIADSLGPKFAPYLEETLKVVLPAVSDQLHVHASITAAEASASLLHSAAQSVADANQSFEPVLKLLVSILTPLLVSLERASETKQHETEYDLLNDTTGEQRAGFASAIERCLRICWYSGGDDNPDGSRPTPLIRPPPGLIKNISIVLRNAAVKSTERRYQAASELSSRGFETEDIEEMIEEICEEEDELMSDLVDSVGYIIKLYGADYIDIFDTVFHPFMTQLINQDESDSLKCNGVCLYDDLIQYCGPAAHKYLQVCFPVMVKSIHSAHNLLKQAALYGIGQVAQHAPAAFRSSARQVASELCALIQQPDAKSEDNIDATENAVSVIGRICSLYQDSVNSAELLPFWLKFLPLTSDLEEAQYCHKLLTEFVESKNEFLIAQSKENKNMQGNVLQIVQVLSFIAVSKKELATKVTKDKIPKLIMSLKNLTPEQDFFAMCNTLKVEQQQAVKQMLQI